jgi:hypothetical protein
MKKEIILVLFITAIFLVSGCLGGDVDGTDNSDNSASGLQGTDEYADENSGDNLNSNDLTPPSLPE